MLAASPESRELYEAGRAFDLDAPVIAGDEQRVSRIERDVQKRLRRSGERSRPSWILRACLAAALITGGAVGAVELTRVAARSSAPAREPAPTPPAPPAPNVVHTHSMSAASSTVQPPAPTAESPPVDPTPTPTPQPPAPTIDTPTRLPQPGRVAVASVPEIQGPDEPPAPADAGVIAVVNVDASTDDGITALALFAAANRARVSGDLDAAIRLSRQLEDQFPATKEAISTHLSLAMLYLQQKKAEPALDELHRYRAVATAATMPEAIWGESQALHLLGRTADERASLEELLASYPQSAYAAAARKRLASLH